MGVIDLTQPLTPAMPHWPGDPFTRIDVAADYSPNGYCLHRVCVGEHSGTHFGAPRHFLARGRGMTDFKAGDFILAAAVIPIEAACRTDPDHLLSIDEVNRAESRWGPVPRDSVVLISTGWARFWNEPERYLGAGSLHFPGISIDAAEYLVHKCGVRGLGIDTAGVDGGRSTRFQVNLLLCEHGLFHLENLARLDLVAARGATLFIGALPIPGGCGSPCRVLALSHDFLLPGAIQEHIGDDFRLSDVGQDNGDPNPAHSGVEHTRDGEREGRRQKRRGDG